MKIFVVEEYNKIYKKSNNIFGNKPEKMLIDFVEKNKIGKFALDIGAGQGRNSFFLAEKGFITDALEPSSVAVEFLNKQNKYDNLTVCKSDFKNFFPEKKYDLILIFGLLQILSYNECRLLAEKVSFLSKKGTIVFVTSFSEKDDSFIKIKEDYAEYKRNFFKKINNQFRSFPNIREISEFFSGFEIKDQKEYTGPIHRHGNNLPEKHEMIELILIKK